jgi:hypothetical protein
MLSLCNIIATETVKRFLTNESITLSDEDNLLVNSYIDNESQSHIGGFLQGANVQTENINILWINDMNCYLLWVSWTSI